MKAINDYINGNLSDAKAAAKRIGWSELYLALRDEYGRDERQARAIANYLKGKGTFQAACDAAGGAKTLGRLILELPEVCSVCKVAWEKHP